MASISFDRGDQFKTGNGRSSDYGVVLQDGKAIMIDGRVTRGDSRLRFVDCIPEDALLSNNTAPSDIQLALDAVTAVTTGKIP